MDIVRLLILVAIIAAVNAINDVEKDKKAVEAKKEQSRFARPEPVRGSFQKLSNMMNRSDEFKNRRRGKHYFNKLSLLNQRNKHENMMNDNEGAITNNKSITNDETNAFKELKSSLRPTVSTYEATYKSNYVPQVTGVFCNFEKTNGSLDMCMWQWNQTKSSQGFGFSVVTSADVEYTNHTQGPKFSAPTMDADFNKDGHFLYLPVDATMENMVIKSPPFRGLREFCKFEVQMHQSKMQNASIRLVSESTRSAVQWILQEFAGNNAEIWQPMRFMIGKVQQEVRIIIEITRPSFMGVTQVLPHIAIDNIRMVECLPEPPVYNGECQFRQLKCKIMKKDSCVKLHQICDLVKDCDNGLDEQQNCVKMPYGSYCNFEQDTCGFENVPQPILKWSRHSGPTPTDKTGPNYDHTCGPPQLLYTTSSPIIPLSPAHRNYSISCLGYYFFVNMNVTGPNKERADFASTAVMKTVIFNPPPKVHGNITSKYYNCCTIRFYYQQNGRNYGSLSVDVVELTSRGNITTSLWFSTKDKGENWYRAAIFLPNITSRYYFLFKTRMGMRIYSDSAIDDFSMAPECFGLNINATELGDYNYYDPVFEEKTTPHPDFAESTVYRFSTCGATGRLGPNQTMCDTVYKNTSVSVTVVNSPPYNGIQVWDVPNEGLYTIIATGASGGLGSMWAGVSHGAQARGLFELHRSEKIYMLVGQQGLNACKKTLSAQESHECSRRTTNDTYQIFTSKTHEVRNTHVNDGGGGGGGATYVFLLGKNGRPIPLLVGGGGGGISVGVFHDDNSQHARGRTNATPESGYMYGTPGRTSGAGGGWLSRRGPITPGFEVVRGSSLQEGGAGGLACNGGAHGGFGGGGGGCLRGGGGGGWAGGSTHDGVGQHGEGGWSYIDNARAIKDYSSAGVALRTGPGEVLIIPAIHACGCNYRCVAMNEYRSDVKCYCPSSWSTDISDPTKCILEDAWSQGWWILVIVLCVIGFVCMMTVPCICLHLYNKYQRKKEAELHQKRLLEQEVQLHRLRSAPGAGENALGMAFNPHYGSESFFPMGVDVKGLPQVAREKLKLIKALGQGAFGEVYQGLYKHQPGDTVEMPVAVKTLPELSTGQAESDFLMEAAIMAKFNHPNIVHIIGVCFDRHPRFIVLELLGGGDLKQFLRDNRPKPDRASALTMKDLILCSLDICKGCKYLESQRFIHRDIAARNCLLTSRGPGRVCKIADFGMARDIYRADYYRKGGKAMLPIKWMPPEAYIDGVFTAKTDVWSFGVLLWEVFSLGVMPYTGCSNREVMQLVSGGGRLDKPYGCPPDVYRLMCECWNPNPEERPSFAQMFDRLQRFLQDPEITSAPLPMMRSLIPLHNDRYFDNVNGIPRSSACDYLVPMSPQEQTPDDSSTGPLVPHSKAPTATSDSPETEASQYPPLVKASQEYGNIPMASKTAGTGKGPKKEEGFTVSGAETRTNTKFLPSNSTDRLLSSVEGASLDGEFEIETDEKPVIWETSFIEANKHALEHKPTSDHGPTVDKLISITPTSPKPPENALSKAIESKNSDKTIEKNKLVPDKVADKNKININKNLLPTDKNKSNTDKNQLLPDKNKNTLGVEKKTAPTASPDPPRINAWAKDPPKIMPKPKPLYLDAAQLEQNLIQLKKNSGSVNLTTMNIVPPYINVVTPNKLSESKTIQIDPKKAIIYDLPAENKGIKQNNKLKQSSSAASLLNGPLTDVPYADSDNTSSSSGSMAGNARNKSYPDINAMNGKTKVKKQGSEGDKGANVEISC